ncbi:GNAT family N-acetyltransferase [Oceanirhabdus sp. W0125-5]|uniref:GNAT family N-acetyltransferase n=1 Tax=Oceanirhabdus sp. W0125-5 TaxID=2999116 RepID=UPI0022F2DA65|nr:GNAT family N-acetyltransferase [Oceanirhabdus sp. W0125-5]WBW99226.1 GNAT family N-acetyltransferase [Oceanirhabdus sp. W0125-5]
MLLNEKEIKVVEYKDIYASGIADMWNKSGDSWGGDTSVKTAKDIINERKNSTDLNLFVALNGEEVAGTCSFARYAFDKNTSYIPLLNVRPDYHGKKVGKKLILKVVEEAIKSDWPRLDLFTWAGNLKAVPLYKKSGFFWEKNEQSVHLMNFLPYVINSEALKDYFEVLHWYDDRKMDIEVKPDGIEEGEFQFFEYLWKKEKTQLRVQFERKGRVLREIETEDYSIKCSLKKQKLIFGKDYEIEFEIVNKSGNDLEISISGMNDREIKNSIDETLNVYDREVINGSFHVGELEEVVTEWITHPLVKNIVTINGKEVVMGLGVEPVYPVKMSTDTKDKQYFKNTEQFTYIDFENSFEEKIQMKFSLPENDYVEFKYKEIEVELESKEKKSVRIPVRFIKSGYIDDEVDVNVLTSNDEVCFKKKLEMAFRGRVGKIGGEDENSYFVSNGRFLAGINKFNNSSFVKEFKKNVLASNVACPSLGEPYSDEFSKKKPSEVTYHVEETASVLRAKFESDDFKDVKITRVMRLEDDGTLEIYHEIENAASDIKDISMVNVVGFNTSNGYMAFDNKLLDIRNNIDIGIWLWDHKKLTENWMFASDFQGTRAMWWDKEFKITIDNYRIKQKVEGLQLQKNCVVKTPSVYMASNTFDNYEELRKVAMGCDDLPELREIEPFDVSINEGNVFSNGTSKLFVNNYKKTQLHGDVAISIDGEKTFCEKIDFQGEDSKKIEFKNLNVGINHIKIDGNFNNEVIAKEKLIFNSGVTEITKEIQEEEGCKVFKLSNGVIEMKASPEFSAGLFSIKYNGEDWLESSYPKKRPKSWFNPWGGGVCMIPSGVSLTSYHEQKVEVKFVEVADEFNNIWSGISSTVIFQKHEKYKGLEIEHMYLTRADIPVIKCVYRATNNSNKNLNTSFERDLFIKEEEKITDSFFEFKDKVGDLKKYKCGKTEIDIEFKGVISVGYNTRKDRMNMVSKGDGLSFAYSVTQDVGIFANFYKEIPHGEDKEVLQEWIIFHDRRIDDREIEDL